MANAHYLESPDLLVTRAFTHTPDTCRRVRDSRGKEITVGDDKFKVVGYFDPASPSGKEFLTKLLTILTNDVGIPAAEAREAVRASLPTLAEASEKTRQALAGKVPDTWRRIKAASSYGPLAVIDTRGVAVAEGGLYEGCTAAVSLRVNPYESQLHGGAWRVSFWPGPVLLVQTGERLFGVNPKVTFAHRLSGGVSNAKVLDDDMPL